MRRQFRYRSACATLVIASTALVCSTAAASSVPIRHGAATATVVDSGPTSETGNVEVTVPPAIVSASDDLPVIVNAGQPYQLDIPVWLAAGQPSTNATIDVVGARGHSCTEPLVAGTITRIHCRLIPTGDAGAVVAVRVDVHVRAAPDLVVATFTHRVQARTTS
jgi:hypothetical protein